MDASGFRRTALDRDQKRKPTRHDELGVVAHANEKATSELPHYEVESYLQYQGRKFTRRFDPNCYVQLTMTLDSHDVAKGRGDYFDVLRSMPHRTMVGASIHTT